MEIAKQLNLFKVLFLKRLRLLKYDYRKEWAEACRDPILRG